MTAREPSNWVVTLPEGCSSGPEPSNWAVMARAPCNSGPKEALWQISEPVDSWGGVARFSGAPRGSARPGTSRLIPRTAGSWERCRSAVALKKESARWKNDSTWRAKPECERTHRAGSKWRGRTPVVGEEQPAATRLAWTDPGLPSGLDSASDWMTRLDRRAHASLPGHRSCLPRLRAWRRAGIWVPEGSRSWKAVHPRTIGSHRDAPPTPGPREA